MNIGSETCKHENTFSALKYFAAHMPALERA